MLIDLLPFIYVFTIFLHPFRISVTEMNYNSQSKSVETTIKIFHDDLEKALSEFYDKPIIIETNKSECNTQIQKYLDDRLHLFVNDKEVKSEFIGFEIEDDVVWSYLEFKMAPTPKKIIVRDNLLIDTFSDQSNLVHFKYNGKIKSRMLSGKEREALFEDVDSW